MRGGRRKQVLFILHNVLTSKLQLAHTQHYICKQPNVETGKRQILPYMHIYLSQIPEAGESKLLSPCQSKLLSLTPICGQRKQNVLTLYYTIHSVSSCKQQKDYVHGLFTLLQWSIVQRSKFKMVPHPGQPRIQAVGEMPWQLTRI